VLRTWGSALLASALILRAAAAAEPAAGVRPPAAAAPASRGTPGTSERLPVRVYTIDDGLAGDEVNVILQDSRGFLWIGTDSGLSRFDGSRFAGYDARHGLPSPNVTALLEDPSGTLLVGTTAGLARLDPSPAAPGRLFTPVPAAGGRRLRRVAALAAEGGSVWAADPTPGGGLFRCDAGVGRGLVEEKLPSGASISGVTALAPDGAGGLWVGQQTGLLHRLAGGSWHAVPVRGPPRAEGVVALLADARQRLWIETASGLYVWKMGPSGQEQSGGSLAERAAAGRCRQATAALSRLPEAPGEVCRFDLAPGLAAPSLSPRRPGRDDAPPALTAGGARSSGGLLQTRDGKVWMVAHARLIELDGEGFRGYAAGNGLVQDELSGLGQDRDGNLWVGTHAHGLMRIAQHGFLTYTAPEPPGAIGVAAIFEDSRSDLYVWGTHGASPRLFRFDGGRLQDVTPESFARAAYLGRGRRQVWAPDAASGELWFGGGAGIRRLSRGAGSSLVTTAPRALWQVPDGMGEVFRLFMDSRGQLWISSLGNPLPGAPSGSSPPGAPAASGARESIHLARWDSGTGRFSAVPQVERLGRGAISAFAEDPYGNLWIGFSAGGLARLRGDAAELLPAMAGGVPPGAVNDLFVDSRQRLWVASSYGGVIRVEDLDARRPRSMAYTTAQGLSSDRVLCVTEDRRGNVYLGHGRGVDRLDPETGGVRTFTTADGLPSSVVNVAHRARDGSLWFGTPAGPARYVPEAPRAEARPLILLGDLRIGGARQPLPPLGVRAVAGLELPAARNQVEVHVIGISFAYGAGLRYQYRLEGSSAGWSDPQPERAMLLSNLAPGDYRFSFRAVTPDNVPSQLPATLSFTLLRPLWQRWWFALLAGVAAALLAWSLHHVRLARIVELERVRTRIAADLHDDLSSSLSRISILSELARRRVSDPGALEAGLLDQIGETARELMEATGDIVWAIDARRDDLESLLVRIRRFAGDLLEGRGVSVLFAAPPRAAEISLRPEAKRELYLVLKEALHNAARHARASEVRIEVTEAGGELVAEVRDDGVGFAPSDPGPAGARSGHGLRNLRERAARVGAKLAVDSAPGAGTRVRLSLRL
jgi:signal transduction histidine kinase/ligand-binding sensor domain-containing protein